MADWIPSRVQAPVRLSPERLVLQRYSTAGLQRNTLTADGKRWQLWGKGIKGIAADEIINALYPELAAADA